MLIRPSLNGSSILFKQAKFTKKWCFTKLYSSTAVKPVKLAFATYENTTTETKEVPFLIIHGLFGSKQNWTSLCKAYSQKVSPARKIIALDLRNHGDSVHTEDHTYAHLCEDIKHFLLDNNLEKVALMGHSMGGRSAMLFALTYPQFLEKLIIVDISPVSMGPQFNELPLMLKAMAAVEMPSNVTLSQARSIVENQLASSIPNKEVRAFLLTNLVTTEDKGYKWRINISTLLRKFDEISQFPAMSGVQYPGDTLFLGGERSSFMPNIKKCVGKNVRFKTDLAQTQNYKSVVDLAYASYQSTEAILGKVNSQEIPTPLLILHGILGSKSNYNTMCKRYHEASKPKRSVYAVDLRNHGDSAHSKENTYDDLIMDVIKFLKSMDLKKVSLIGHDIGGRLGMLLSLKYPDLVDRIIVSDISPITTSHNFKVFPEILRTLQTLVFPPNLSLQQARAHVINSLSRIIRNKGLMTSVLGNLVQNSDGSYSWRFNNKALLEHFQELSAFPEIHNVYYEGPALFLGGSKSDYIQKSDYPKILKLFPNAELKYIEGAGHWVHVEKPTEFLKVTMDFLNRNPPNSQKKKTKNRRVEELVATKSPEELSFAAQLSLSRQNANTSFPEETDALPPVKTLALY